MNSTIERQTEPLKKVINLAIALAVGYILVINAVIFGTTWYPVLVGMIFFVAYIPVIISRTVVSLSDYDFNFDPLSNSQALALEEAAQFISALLFTTALSIPFVLHHSHLMTSVELVLTLVGGGLIFSSVYLFYQTFAESKEDDEFGNDVV